MKKLKPFKLSNQFKMPKEPKEPLRPHIITPYEERLIRLLCPVIQSKKLIRFWYDDKTTNFEGSRLVQPHLIGQTRFKAANILLVAWFLPTPKQILDGHNEKWGSYILDEVKDIEILPQQYTRTQFNYNPNDSRMTMIFCATSPRMR